MITVGATVIALVPLAAHGGPLWAGLCYAQIGGLLVATVVTLLLVPVLYAIVVRDLKWVKWEPVTAPLEVARAPVAIPWAAAASVVAAAAREGEDGEGEGEAEGPRPSGAPQLPGRPPAPWGHPDQHHRDRGH
jgi:hypothetical protein